VRNAAREFAMFLEFLVKAVAFSRLLARLLATN